MAELIDNVIVRQGKLIRVANQAIKKYAKQTYIAVWVEDGFGENSECLLFTEGEIKHAQERAKKNPEDIPHKDHWFARLIDKLKLF